MVDFRFGHGERIKANFVLDVSRPTTQDMRMLPFERIAPPVSLDATLKNPELAITVWQT